MNKFISLFLVLLSFSLHAQEESSTSLEFNDEGVESNPLEGQSERPVEEVVADPQVVEEAPASEVAIEERPVKVTETPVASSQTEVEQDERFNPRESHWVSTFGFEYAKYEVVPEGFEFEGEKGDFKTDYQELWGGRLGFGGELYLGAGFVTRTMVEGYYVGTLFSRVLNGGEVDEEVKFAYTKKTGQIIGADATQSLGWMFDFKTKNPFMEEWSYLTVEPFVEAGIGKAYAYNRLNYSYQLDTTDEAHKIRVRDDLLNARLAAGINMTSTSGFFLTLKASINRFEVTQRKIDGFTKPNGQAREDISETQKDAKIDPVVMYTLGGGYKF